MKKIPLYLLLILFILSLFTSCEKNNNQSLPNASHPPATTGRSMTAVINGKYEVANSVSGNRSYVNTPLTIYIMGVFDDGHQLTITVPAFKEAGTYMLNNSAASMTGTASWVAEGETGTFSNSAKDGLFIVSNSSGAALTGTFSFTTNDSTEITNGTVTVLF